MDKETAKTNTVDLMESLSLLQFSTLKKNNSASRTLCLC